MIERNVRNGLQKLTWKDKDEGMVVAVPTATSFFMLAVLSLGIFSSGMTNEVHADALPCDPSTATCIDPDCDPTITSCPPVDPPRKESFACGPNAASACAPSVDPLNSPRTDHDDVVGEESGDERTGRPMMDNSFSWGADGETGNDKNKNGNENDDEDGPDNNRVNQNNEQGIKNVKKGSSAGNEASDNAELDNNFDDSDEDQNNDQEIDGVKKGSNS